MDPKTDVYDSREHKKSRIAYMMECTFEYFVVILISDAYLSSLLTSLGMSDYMVGVLSSFGSLAFVFQLISMFLVQRLTDTKILPSIIHFVGRLFFVALYFIPFFDFIPSEYKWIAAFICVVLGYLGNYAISTIIYRWGNSFVHPARRATFSAAKEMISLVCGMIFTFIIGQLVDYYDSVGAPDMVFIFLGATVFVSALLDFICLMIMKREKMEESLPEHKPISAIIGDLVNNKGYITLVILECLHKSSLYIIIGFLGTFKLKELSMTIGLVSIVTIIATVARFFASGPFGRLTDKTSYATGITVGLAIQTVSYLFLIFIAPEMWWMIIGYQVLYSVSLAATNQNFYNAVYSYVDKEHFVQAFAIKNCVSGVVGFLVSLGAGAIVNAVQGESGAGMFTILGADIYVQQLLAIFAFALTLVSLIFTVLVVRKNKIIGK